MSGEQVEVPLTREDAAILVRGTTLQQRIEYLKSDGIDLAAVTKQVRLRGVQLDMWGHDETA